MTKIKYVVGFMLDPDRKYVILIHKKHGPPSVVGKWNGVGGKIEIGETASTAMVREFEEECGIATQPEDWKQFCILESRRAQVFFFHTIAESQDVFDSHQTLTDEEVGHAYIPHIHSLPPNIMPNLRWMLPFLIEDSTQNEIGTIKFLDY